MSIDSTYDQNANGLYQGYFRDKSCVYFFICVLDYAY